MSSDLVIFLIKLLLFRKLYKNGIWVIAAKRKGVYVHGCHFSTISGEIPRCLLPQR